MAELELLEDPSDLKNLCVSIMSFDVLCVSQETCTLVCSVLVLDEIQLQDLKLGSIRLLSSARCRLDLLNVHVLVATKLQMHCSPDTPTKS